MSKIKELFFSWLGRIADGFAVWPLIPVSVTSLAFGYASTALAVVKSYGLFGWLSVALLVFLVLSLALLAIGSARYQMALAKATVRWSEVLDNVNPLENEFTRKRIKLADFVNPTTSLIKGKTFTDCELVGPGVIVSAGTTNMYGAGFRNCNFLAIRDDRPVAGAIFLDDVRITGGFLENLTIFMQPQVVQGMRNSNMPFLNMTGIPELDRVPNHRFRGPQPIGDTQRPPV